MHVTEPSAVPSYLAVSPWGCPRSVVDPPGMEREASQGRASALWRQVKKAYRLFCGVVCDGSAHMEVPIVPSGWIPFSPVVRHHMYDIMVFNSTDGEIGRMIGFMGFDRLPS